MLWLLRKKLLVFLVLLVGLCSQLFCLSSEEVQELGNLDKETLIEIILIYDNSLSQIENEQQNREGIWTERNNLLIERENSIEKKENQLIEQEASLEIRESLLVESLKLQKENNKSQFWSGFGYGNISGVAGGVVVTTIVVSIIKSLGD